MPTERPATPDDLALVTGLLVACDIEELGFPDWSEEDQAEEWRNSRLDLARDSLVVLDGDRAVAYAQVTPRVEGLDYDTQVFALRDHADVEPRLLEFAEARARETALPGAVVHVGVHPSRAAAVRAAGYEHVRTFWRMETPLVPPLPEPAVPDGLVLRHLEPGDERALYATLSESFEDHYRHRSESFEEWGARVMARSDFDPRLALLVLDGDEVAGGLVGMDSLEVGWIRTLGVRKPWRGRGLGLALLYGAFREFASRGVTRAALGVDAENTTGATELYERAGMSVAHRFDFYRKSLDA